MRVLLASLHPRPFSGQIHSVRALARRLDAAGNEVRLRIAGLEGGEGADRPAGLARCAATSLGLVREIARDLDEADVAHLYLPTPGFTFLADWLAARSRTPLVVSYEAPLISRDLAGSVARQAWREPVFYLPRLLINNRAVAAAAQYRAAAYVVSSRYQQAQLRQLGVQRPVAVIPNLVDAPEAGESEGGADDQALARERIGLPESVPLVGYVGHFHPVKGVETLVRAFARLTVRAPEARLVLAWSGLGDRAAIAALLDRLGCADRTIWLGRTRLPDFLRSLDVLAQPYRYPIGQNAYPNVLLEAQGFGVPLVSTRIPIVSEACQESETALLVPPDEPEPLAAAIGRLFEDRDLREAMVRRQRLWYAERFDPARLVWRYEALYRGALRRVPEAVAAAEGALEPGRLVPAVAPKAVKVR